MPSKTRCLVLFIETKNFDEWQIESMKGRGGSPEPPAHSAVEQAIEVNRPYLTARLTKGLSRSVNRHGRCAERLMPMRLSDTTSKVERELATKQCFRSEHRSIS